jgi:hypothetical protein
MVREPCGASAKGPVSRRMSGRSDEAGYVCAPAGGQSVIGANERNSFCKEGRELWRVRKFPKLSKLEFTLEYWLARFAGRGNGIENRFEGLFRA